LIQPGTDWDREIDAQLRDADLYLFLVSADFLASEYIRGTELSIALERHQAKKAVAVPVILRPVDWSQTPFARLQALPRDGKPVTRWSDTDEAMVDIVRGIRELTVSLREIRD
jgi:hypothetical protein